MKHGWCSVDEVRGRYAGALRAEANGMAEAYATSLIESAPPGAIVGVYVKGSSQHPWDSEIDYVPELSDVDIHVSLAPEARGLLRSLPFSLEVGRRALADFTARFPAARHTPRPQLIFLEELVAMPGYLPSPPATVRTLHGPTYEAGTRAQYVGAQRVDGERFEADARFMLDELASKVIDRPDRLLWPLVSRMTWRVGPAGARLLTHLGVDPFDAWSMNRSTTVRMLEERGHEALARHFADFYRAGWTGFLSNFEDGEAARRALEAVHSLYAEGLELVTGQQRSIERPPSVEVVAVPESDKVLLRNLMQAYHHDLSEFTGDIPDEKGAFAVGEFFDAYWVEPERYPFKLLLDGAVAGFALVREVEAGRRSIAEFFVLRAYRGRGVGRSAARTLFDRLPGVWHVAQDELNQPAQRFWRSVIEEYTDGSFDEGRSEAHPVGPQQTFTTRAGS